MHFITKQDENSRFKIDYLIRPIDDKNRLYRGLLSKFVKHKRQTNKVNAVVESLLVFDCSVYHQMIKLLQTNESNVVYEYIQMYYSHIMVLVCKHIIFFLKLFQILLF